MGETRFAGFPDGRLEATAVPSLLFSELLAQVDDLGELKLVLYLFWLLRRKKTYPRFFTRRELVAEPTVRAGLAGIGGDALGASLERLVSRGVLLHRTMELNREPEECYFINTASGRKAVSDLESGRLDLGQVVLSETTPDRPARTSIFDLYEQNVGLLTPLIVDELGEAERRYPGDWIEEAFRQAVSYNRRSWKYVERILERWAAEGKRDEAGGRGAPRARRP
ncbi:MAG TPA: DnaD domain protein [Chloroflexota bacterium]|nr:DnaD domain protein [Chloroflexota bacterium]